MNNYRPISLLSIFDTIIEKIMHVRHAFMEENNILFENQFGFRKQNSTVHALIQIIEQRSSIANGKYGCGIFYRPQESFCFCKPCNSFKENVYLNGHASALKEIWCGIPQGSVLGPLLFLIYINDIPNISEMF